MASKSSNIAVARFITDKTITLFIFELIAAEFSTLRPNIWINGLIIYAFAVSCIDEWEQVTYVPTDDTAIMIGECSTRRINRQKAICQTKRPLKENVFLPYMYAEHWGLLIINVKERKLILLDPYENETDKNRAAEAFKNFILHCDTSSTFFNLRDIKLEDTEITGRLYQLNNDGHCCGAYFESYMDKIGRKIPFNINFNPS